MNRSIDGVVSTERGAGSAPFGRPFTRRVPTFEPRLSVRVSKDRPSGSTSGRVSLPKGAEPAPRTHKNWKERLQLPIIVIGGMLAGLAIQNAMLGQLLIVGYGIAAIMYKIPSRTSFIVALASMLITLGSLVLIGDVVTSQTFAVYTFLLLVVGVITLNREVKREGGRVYSRRYR
ncbi:MAG: hypothetical protein ACREGD_00730 [Candidatus Saccharimonadales bacterium]